MPRPEPTVWTDAEVEKTRWVRDCNQCPFNNPGDYDELGWPERERTCGHPEGGGRGYELTDGKGRCPLPWHPVTVRFGWRGRPGV